MNERRWPIDAIFLEAIELTDDAARAAYLDSACAGDDELRECVERLVATVPRLGTFMEQPPIDLKASSNDAAVDTPSSRELSGQMIGPYKLLQKLGEGGMGVVYLAEQEQPVKRRVAIKVIRAGMDTDQVIRRFEQERQALALMDHPNIARVLEAGATADGRPFFAMELVQGIPITTYCDQEQLSISDRLGLFIPLCQAMQHAHGKGIIHRDLKPSNVIIGLYDGRPLLKVIDFGVAKATGQRLIERTLATEIGQIVGTLEYMAPEQAELNQLEIDTRADIYSLGVLLYELLTGSPPFTAQRFRDAGFMEMLRIIKEVEPTRPSTKITSSDDLPRVAADRRLEPRRLARLVSGELDWITMKCLEKDRGRRYPTANGLALDLQRFLAGEPVQAGPPTIRYRLRRFAGTHRMLLPWVATVLLVSVVAAVVSIWQAVKGTLNLGVGDPDVRMNIEAPDALGAIRAFQGHTHSVWSVAFSPDGRRILSGGWDKTLRLWDVDAGMELACLQGPVGAIWSVAFTPDGRHALSAEGGRNPIRLWDLESQQPLGLLEGHTEQVLSVAISPDGAQALSGSADKTMRLWDVSTRQLVRTFEGHTGNVRCVAFTPDGRQALSGGGGWDQNGRTLDTTMRLWDLQSGELVRSYDGHAPLESVAISPDGGHALSGGWDKMLRLWDLESGAELRRFAGHSEWVTCVAFSPDGRRAISSSGDHTVRLWDVDTGHELQCFQGHTAGVQCVAFSPDGRSAVSGAQHPDNTMRLWQLPP